MHFKGFKQLISFEQPEAQLHGVLFPLEVSLGLDATQKFLESNINVFGQGVAQFWTRQVLDKIEVEVEYKVLISTTLLIIENRYIKHLIFFIIVESKYVPR